MFPAPSQLHNRLSLGQTLLILAFWALAFLTPAEPDAAATDLSFGKGLLWRVETPQGTASHIFGTMHSADSEVVSLPAPVQDSLDAASSVVLEIVMDNRVQMTLAQSMLLLDGRNLGQIAGQQRLEGLVSTGARYGMAPAQLQMFKPWALVLFFSLPPSEFQRQSAGRQPLDQLIQSAAQQQGKAVYGLETAEEQISVFSGLREADQLTLLDLTVASHDQIEPVFEEMRQAYLARDLQRLFDLKEEMVGNQAPVVREVYDERMIYQRNEHMAQRLTGRLKDGGAFVAVGALHLPGERGVLSLLEKRGYKITLVY